MEGVRAALHFLPVETQLGPPENWRAYIVAAFKAADKQLRQSGELSPLVHFHLPEREGEQGSWIALLNVSPLCRLGINVARDVVRQVVRDMHSDGFFTLAEGWQDGAPKQGARFGVTALEKGDAHPERPSEALVGTLETPIYRMMFVASILNGKGGRRLGRVKELRESWFETPFSVWNIPTA